ncbi:MAG: endonuclease/exonuclease/phosphatase family protein [Prevotella sp.]|nr:endonuclease/exonuclease/phosphatase family protein [Prevotella sp.]
MKGLKTLTLRLLAGANVVSIAVMLLVGYSDRISPADYPMATVIGLTFPIVLAVNLIFLVFWLIVKVRYSLIPIIGLLLCFQHIRTFVPLNIRHNPPADALKVLSYNVCLFAEYSEKKDDTSKLLHYIINQNADIVCLQEATTYEKVDFVDSVMDRSYQYCDTVNRKGEDVLRIYSRYPIVGKVKLIPSNASASAAAFHLLNSGDTVTVINCHLQSIGLSRDDKKAVSKMIDGNMQRDSAREESRFLVQKITDAAIIRAAQVEAIAQYIDRLPGNRSIILCGDFNDGPISYTRHTIARRLTDCYVATANGQGISYNKSPFYVRIDNIMCSSDWQPIACKIDRETAFSDHYPIISWLKKRSKP